MTASATERIESKAFLNPRKNPTAKTGVYVKKP